MDSKSKNRVVIAVPGARVVRIGSANCVPCRANEFARTRSPSGLLYRFVSRSN